MISVCIIAKNEENTIAKCLQSLQAYPFEIVVVDTGSTDKTKEIASQYTKNIYDFLWTGDFSEARNYSISKASNDWILVLDCDEYLEPFDISLLYKQLQLYEQSLGTILIKNISSQSVGTVFPNVRIFNKKYYYYQYKVHEQPVGIVPQSSYKVFCSPISIIHTGYDLDCHNAYNKYKRNISLLERALEDCNEFSKPYFYFQLAQSYGALHNYSDSNQQDTNISLSRLYYEKALEYNISPSTPYYKLMVIQYGNILFITAQYKKALQFLERSDSSLQKFADYNVLLAKIYIQMESYEKSIMYLEKAITLTDFYSQGCNTYIPYYYLGMIYQILNITQKAVFYYEQCIPFLGTLDVPAALLYYNMGKCYYLTADYQSAAHYFDKGLSFDAEPSEAYVKDMVLLYGLSLLALEQYSDALCLEGVFDIFGEWNEYLLLMGTIYMKNGLFNESIEAYSKAASMFTKNEESERKQIAYYNIGIIYECTNHLPQAVNYYKKCADYAPAIARLDSINGRS